MRMGDLQLSGLIFMKTPLLPPEKRALTPTRFLEDKLAEYMSSSSGDFLQELPIDLKP